MLNIFLTLRDWNMYISDAVATYPCVKDAFIIFLTFKYINNTSNMWVYGLFQEAVNTLPPYIATEAEKRETRWDWCSVLIGRVMSDAVWSVSCAQVLPVSLHRSRMKMQISEYLLNDDDDDE